MPVAAFISLYHAEHTLDNKEMLGMRGWGVSANSSGRSDRKIAWPEGETGSASSFSAQAWMICGEASVPW